LVIQERTGANAIRATYSRGLDLSGGFQGSGGIGGLLARTDSAVSAFYHSDGSGNVTALSDPTEGIAARYLYEPYGRVLGQWGSLASVNPYRFSSKETDASGLSYYGFRSYDPGLQRWLNPDPLGEAGGINLYGFVGNNPLSYVDPHGEFAQILLIAAAALILAPNSTDVGAPPPEFPPPLSMYPPATEFIQEAGLKNIDGLTLGSSLRGGMQEEMAELNAGLITAPLFTRTPCLGAAKTAPLRSNPELVQEIAIRAEAWGARQGLPAAGGGPVQGTLKHDYAKRLLERYQSIHGDRGLIAERSWLNGARAEYGTAGSVRLDVFDTTSGMVYDYKFTLNSSLSPALVQRIINGGPAGITGVVPVGP
jgi:RHS repeat-associated protein